jgi:hypothetical protein
VSKATYTGHQSSSRKRGRPKGNTKKVKTNKHTTFVDANNNCAEAFIMLKKNKGQGCKTGNVVLIKKRSSGQAS